MKTIGLLSFTSRSLIKYFFELNILLNEKYGVNSSVDILINSIESRKFIFDKKRTKELVEILSQKLISLEKGGADFILIGGSSPHILFDEFKNAVDIPIIDIADVVGEIFSENNFKKVGLLSTRSVFDNNFYTSRCKNIEILTPEYIEDVDFVNDVIYNELIDGIHNIDSRNRIIEISEKMVQKGAEAIILGSPEFIYFITDEYISVPVIDMTLAHTKKAFELISQP